MLGDKVNTADAQTVYMADKAWRVIGYDGTGAASAPGMATLHLSSSAKTAQFSRWGGPNAYNGSALKAAVEAMAPAFADGERSAIRTRDLASGSYDGLNTDCIAGDEVKDALLWPLSAKEAASLARPLWKDQEGAAKNWWLRSPGYNSFWAMSAIVLSSDARSFLDGLNVDCELAVRPAFYLNPESLVLTSAAEGGKSSGAEGANSLKPVGTNPSGEWKVTVKSGHDGFTVRKVTANWGKKAVVVSYEGAATGENEHISAIIEDAGGNVKYYGNLKSCASAGDASGTVELDGDGKLGDGDRLYVFNEQLNGDKKTDYASELVEVEVPAGSSNYLPSGRYRVSKDMTLNPKRGLPNGLRLAHGAKVLIYIDEGVTLTVNGRSASGYTRHGSAAIYVGASSTLIITGKGTLNATGGNAGNGDDGGKAEGSSANRTGDGGKGGDGGGGAGAGIGTDGGAGGAGGAGGEGVSCDGGTKSNSYGSNGSSGSAGSSADPAGTVIVTGSVTVNAKGGKGGNGGKGGSRGGYVETRNTWDAHAAGTSGGGGGGAGGGAADGIGSGGTGGGGGGGGASANVDGECAFFKGCDLDDLWGYGGSGGSSAWGGGSGSRGDYGASNGGDSTGASTSDARAGGSGGSCAAPRMVTFYTYKAFGSTPTVTCKSGHDATRGATSLSLVDFEKLGGDADMAGDPSALSGGLAAQAAQSGGAPALSAQAADSAAQGAQPDGAPALLAQAGGDAEPTWVDSGTETVEVEEGVNVEAAYKVAYYDEAGNPLDAEPADPGKYAALVRYTCPAPYEDRSGDWTVRFSIDKRQVAVPTPAELTFKVADWETGEGAEQDAFEGLDDNIEFVEASKEVDGETVASTRSAKEVGGYEACFRLKDPETCEWADGSDGSGEVWVRWSIAPDTYDPNSEEITYWGTAYDDATTTVGYTGEPIWVRPWYAPTKSIGGEFPEWITHWGDAGRPTDDRSSACVVYLGEGMEDHAGIVGYHTNADGSLEQVTGAQVYAWMCGVDVDGKHVDVQSGDKVWYKVGDGDEVAVLAVQSEEPEGADGCVVARDLAYADKLGVMDEGTYEAYALFDEGTGFEPTAVAETTVKVKADGSKAAAATPKTGTETKSSAASTPKTGDFSPFVVGGIVLVGLLAAGGIALSLARRRR